MTNELQVINEQVVLGKEFKIYGDAENPLFLAKDVADWLEMDTSNASRMIKNVDKDECITTRHNKTNATFLTEDGLYEVLMQSRKPIAKEFKKKIKEIIKDIRKTGGYVGNEEMFINTYLPFADDNTKMMFKMTLQTVRVQNETIDKQNNQLIEQKPLVSFAERCLKSKDSILVRELAKVITEEGIINIGEKKLFTKLREWGLILQTSTEPSQRAMDMKLFDFVQRPIRTPYGDKLVRTPMVLPKGQVYIVERLNKEIEDKKVAN
ncbi:phage antirepressor [Lysinibacillus agricola]|uniref:phage antirepressor n=1 Tax=Lysinibacillus agricola TaxID=2590012 RepID=UPI003C145CF2